MSPLQKRLMPHAPAVLLLVFLIATPAFLPTSIMNVLIKILIYGLLAMSLDLVFGYTGLWSFGHAALFGVAAYTVSILVGKLGVESFWILAPAGLAAAGIAAAFFAFVGLKTRGLYFMLVTFALGELTSSVASTWRSVTGGSDGLWDVPYPNLGFSVHLDNFGFYYLTLALVAVSAVIIRKITRSPFGYSLMSIQDNEIRARTLGYNTYLRRLAAFIISGLFAGLAGILYVYFNAGISPAQIGMSASGVIMIMVIVGGTGTIWGGLAGSIVILGLEYFVSLITPQYWPLFLGVIFIAAVFFAGDGIYPKIAGTWRKAITHANR